MSILELFVLAIGLSMDAFAVSICKGLSLGKIKKRDMLIAGAWFGGFQAFMPLLGYFLGSFFSKMIMGYAHWIAFVLLIYLGISMYKESRDSECDEMDASMKTKDMFILAVSTSIDALAVGVTFAFLRVQIIPAVSFIGVITFVCSSIGVKIGSLFGEKYKSKAEMYGGVILMFIGIKILLDGLGVL